MSYEVFVKCSCLTSHIKRRSVVPSLLTTSKKTSPQHLRNIHKIKQNRVPSCLLELRNGPNGGENRNDQNLLLLVVVEAGCNCVEKQIRNDPTRFCQAIFLIAGCVSSPIFAIKKALSTWLMIDSTGYHMK